MMREAEIRNLQENVWQYYREYGRHELPWRLPEADGSFDAYKITVSEIMLQQTQVKRVIPKYEQFLAQFPEVADLAGAELGAVLRAWSGLGYNRRAKFLWLAARQVRDEYGGQFPQKLSELTRLPGIGANTAGAILAYTFDQPVVFLETNIRTAFIHHFFTEDEQVSDKQLLELVAQALDREHPREWYWALMDYGAFLKQSVGNLNRQSVNFARQSAFQGSRRQLRGQVIRLLAERPRTPAEMTELLADKRLSDVLHDLLQERMIREQDGRLTL